MNPINNFNKINAQYNPKKDYNPIIKNKIKEPKETFTPQTCHQPSTNKKIEQKKELKPPSSPINHNDKINKFTPLIDDEIFTKDIMNEIEKAGKSIQFETFLLNGKDGKELCDLLIKKKNQGIDVKVILDPKAQLTEKIKNFGDSNYSLGKYLKKNGVNCINYDTSKLKGSPIHADHAKILVVDDKIAYLGGTNVDDDLNHDMNIKIEGPAAKDIRKFFDESWDISTNSDKKFLGYISDPAIKSTDEIKVFTNSPSRSTIKPQVLKNIKEAKESIQLQMFTFSDDDIEKALIDAKKQGVDVKVIMYEYDKVLDIPSFGIPNIAAANKLQKANIPVKWYKNNKYKMMHSKLCIFDNKKAMLGSANFIHGAAKGIHEYYGEVDNKEFVDKMTKQFNEDWEKNSEDFKGPSTTQAAMGKIIESIDQFIL